ncbi:MAG: hypothetical protein CSA13_00070 [Clostridiales bacterium]|nr:MAG: hypothetical protein CSA13_00070 [Clostridiales bacterium]
MKKKKTQRHWSDYLWLLLIAIVVFFTPNAIAYVKLNYFSSLLEMRELASIDIASDIPISAFAMPGGIACCSDDQLNVYSYDGKLNYQRQLFGKRTIVRVAGDHIVVVDLARGEIAKLSLSLELVDKKRNIGQIVDVLTTDQGDVICQMSADNAIRVFDANLDEKALITVPTDRVIEIMLSADQSTILVSTVAIEELVFKSYVLQYDLQGRPTATGDLEGELLFNAYLMDHQVLVTQSKIKSYNRESKKVAEILNIEKIDQTAAHKHFLYTSYMAEEDGVEQPYLSIYSDDLSYRQQLKLAALPEHIIVNDKFIITYAEGTLYIYDHSLRSLKSLQTHRNIKGIQWLDASHLMAYDQSHINVYVLD